MQFSESLLLHVLCVRKVLKMFTLKFDINEYSSLQNKILEMPKSKRTVTYASAATYQNVHVCVTTQMCIYIYVTCTKK